MKKYNEKTDAFETINCKFPSFVIDAAEFDKLCTHAIANFDAMKYTARIAKKAEEIASEKDAEEKAILVYEQEQLEHALYMVKQEAGEADTISNTFVLALGFASAKIGVAGFNDLYLETTNYSQFLGSEKWSQERKASFSKIKQEANSLFQNKFGKGDGKLYKPFTVELNSTYIEVFISATLGHYARVSEGKKDNRTFGLTCKVMKKEQSYLELCRCLFDKYGCHIDKGVRFVDVIL